MRLLSLIEHNAALPRAKLLLAAAAAGIASTLVLALVNRAAHEIAASGYDSVDWPLALTFLGCLGLYIMGEIYLLGTVGALVEEALDTVRVRLLDLTRRADLRKLEEAGAADLRDAVARDIGAISQMSQFIAMGFRSTLLLLALAIYIGWVSLVAVAVLVVGLGIAVTVYVRRGFALQRIFQRAMLADGRIYETVVDLLDGFKEVRLSSARSRDLGAHFATVSDTVAQVRGGAQVGALDQMVFGQVAFYAILGVLVFVVPQYVDDYSSVVVKVTTATLFMLGPLGVLVQVVAVLGGAEASAGRLFETERRLEEMRETTTDHLPPATPLAFDTLTLRDIRYVYPAAPGDAPFEVGPLSLTLRPGQITFITGGNGSGKSTFIKVVCGLYRPTSGSLRIDDRVVTDRLLPAWRGLISAVFSDYHLFRRLYGLEDADPDRLAALLDLMEMSGLTGVHDGVFDTVDLSAGQRKRLALVTALLEDRPVLVLDEWAADQDPQFRRTFYRTLLPRLRAEGKAILAVTHDDHYFDVADRRLHMEAGRVIETTGFDAGSSWNDGGSAPS